MSSSHGNQQRRSGLRDRLRGNTNRPVNIPGLDEIRRGFRGERSSRGEEGRSASPSRQRAGATTDDLYGGGGGGGGAVTEHEIIQLERRRNDHGDLVDILRDALPRMQLRDADSPSMPTLRQRNNDAANNGGGASGSGSGFGFGFANFGFGNNNGGGGGGGEEESGGLRRLQFGESYLARRAQAEARYDADDVSLADSENTGTTVRTAGASDDDDDDETMSVDSYMSRPSSFGGGSEGWAGGDAGMRRVSQMSHRKPSASIRTFEVARNNDDDDDGGGRGEGGRGLDLGRKGGGGGDDGERGGVTYGEYVGVGVGLCFLLVFSYAVQYLVRHGVIVAPTVKN